MGLKSEIVGKKICLDTAPIIYFIEEHREYFNITETIFHCIANNETSAVISTISLLEVLVLPYKVNNIKLAETYKRILLNSPGMTVIPVSSEIAEIAAKLRGKYLIKTPDAIQIATGLYTGANFYITNDVRFKKVSEINVLILSDYL